MYLVLLTLNDNKKKRQFNCDFCDYNVPINILIEHIKNVDIFEIILNQWKLCDRNVNNDG